ncbi:hypothetical protein RHSIM_Rhsim07G0235600 [Rhododendron simsii]|uniref:Thaumatin-like protein n=1 Tax=Rhododendron simsii TaxID=118357 RepID=A0A834GPD9_RHOSS|nr:hypothetical protein RHSIM_Rhsim07G0235600 [Rhododendron simsii]
MAAAASHWPLAYQPNSRLQPVGQAGSGSEQIATLTDPATEHAPQVTAGARSSALEAACLPPPSPNSPSTVGQAWISTTYNVGIGIQTSGGTGDCKYAGCIADLNAICPPELQVTSTGSVAACKSTCEAFNTPQYCCTRNYSTPATCRSTQYSELYKQACPDTYSYAYDDASSTFTCTGADYLITFCPQ